MLEILAALDKDCESCRCVRFICTITDEPLQLLFDRKPAKVKKTPPTKAIGKAGCKTRLVLQERCIVEGRGNLVSTQIKTIGKELRLEDMLNKITILVMHCPKYISKAV